ncbi:hypothetical protein HYX12_00525 [Candidatus Woesearchaeota archaeon]|nr:hypothetical protein [Candidatus Woesearchaeota archaeon]
MVEKFQVLFLLGITNVLCLLLISLSCRCMGMHKLTNHLFKYDWYKKFYSYHCYYWYALYISVISHAILAFAIFRWPF